MNETEKFYEFTGLVSRVGKALRRAQEKYTRDFGLRSVHVSCLLRLLDAPGGLSATELSERCGVDRAQISRVSADLAERGLVCEAALFTFAQKIGLGRWLRLGHGEEMGGGRTRPSVVSDAFEAVIAALYLDGGIDAARAFILPFVTSALTKQSAEEDYKTKLQEVVQQNPSERLRYVVASQTGPDHDKHFVVEVHLNSNCIGSGEGHSKKQAEQAAAKEALALMGY